MKRTEIDTCKDEFGHVLHIGDPVIYAEASFNSAPRLYRDVVSGMYMMQKREYVILKSRGYSHLAKYTLLDYEKLYEMQRFPMTRTIVAS